MLNWDKLKKYKLPVILMTAGILLFAVISIFWDKDDSAMVYVSDETAEIQKGYDTSYDTSIEDKLEKILAATEGVGKVKVAVSLLDSGEIYPFIKEEVSGEENGEKDSAGGTRDKSSQSSKSEASVIRNSDGSESVVISRSDMPRISGVIVCAEGGDSYVVKERIINAVKALCNIEINRIEILPMK